MPSSNLRQAQVDMASALRDVFKKYTRSTRKRAWKTITSDRGHREMDKLLIQTSRPVTRFRALNFREWIEKDCEFDQKLEQRRLVISILEQNGYNPDDFDIDFLIEAGILQRIGDWAKEKGKKFTLPLALAAGIGGFGGGMAPGSAEAGIRQVVPSRSATTDIRQVTPSKASSLVNLFRQGPGGSYIPAQGNGVLIKDVTSVAQDELKGDVHDFTVYNQADPSEAVNVKATGRGINAEDAIKDALRQAGHQGIGAHVKAVTVAKNDELEKDTTVVSGAAVIHNFKILNYQQNPDGIWEASIEAGVSKPSGRFSGGERYHRVSDAGDISTYKDVIR